MEVGMFVYIFIVSYFSYGLCSSDVMKVLWEQDVPLRRVLVGEIVPDADMNVIISRLSQLPFTEELKSDAWFKLSQYRSLERLDIYDWKALESLIPFLPANMLRALNFSDESVLDYFGKLKFKRFKLSVMAEAVAEQLGSRVLNNESQIMKMGNIFCGFSTHDLADIDRSTLRSLLEGSFFKSVRGCSIEQLRALTNTLQYHTIIGPPRTWKPETVSLAGNLLAGLDVPQLREIRDRSFSFVTPEVIEMTPAYVLKEIRKSQVLSLQRSSLLAWRRRTKDLTPLHSGQENSVLPAFFPYISLFFYCY